MKVAIFMRMFLPFYIIYPKLLTKAFEYGERHYI